MDIKNSLVHQSPINNSGRPPFQALNGVLVGPLSPVCFPSGSSLVSDFVWNGRSRGRLVGLSPGTGGSGRRGRRVARPTGVWQNGDVLERCVENGVPRQELTDPNPHEEQGLDQGMRIPVVPPVHGESS